MPGSSDSVSRFLSPTRMRSDAEATGHQGDRKTPSALFHKTEGSEGSSVRPLERNGVPAAVSIPITASELDANGRPFTRQARLPLDLTVPGERPNAPPSGSIYGLTNEDVTPNVGGLFSASNRPALINSVPISPEIITQLETCIVRMADVATKFDDAVNNSSQELLALKIKFLDARDQLERILPYKKLSIFRNRLLISMILRKDVYFKCMARS